MASFGLLDFLFFQFCFAIILLSAVIHPVFKDCRGSLCFAPNDIQDMAPLGYDHCVIARSASDKAISVTFIANRGMKGLPRPAYAWLP